MLRRGAFLRRLWREGTGRDLPDPSRALLSVRSLFWFLMGAVESAIVVLLVRGGPVEFFFGWAFGGILGVLLALPRGEPDD